MSENDPLDGADVGETKTVERSKTLHSATYEPGVYYGSDRIGSAEIADVEIVEDEYGEDAIRVTWEGDLTKALPPNWDHHREPVTERELRQERRKKWKGRAGRAAQILIPAAICVGIAAHVMNTISGEVTMNGEPVGTPGFESIAFVFGLVVIIMLGVQYAPRTIRGGRHA